MPPHTADPGGVLALPKHYQDGKTPFDYSDYRYLILDDSLAHHRKFAERGLDRQLLHPAALHEVERQQGKMREQQDLADYRLRKVEGRKANRVLDRLWPHRHDPEHDWHYVEDTPGQEIAARAQHRIYAAHREMTGSSAAGTREGGTLGALCFAAHTATVDTMTYEAMMIGQGVTR